MIPPFMEIQEFLYENMDGEIEDVVPEFVPIDCVISNMPVCADGINFINQCNAEAMGFTVTTLGNCPIEPLPEPLPPAVDGGTSEEYNHDSQELSECPDTRPDQNDDCDGALIGTACHYGVTC